MSKNDICKNNFIRHIIEKDLISGKHNIVHTRFPPEPNGYLHIGHAKSICLNFGIAKDYNGFCNLRFDDTNPVAENIEYVQSIKKDLQWLGFEWNGAVRYASDYFDQLYQYAIELILKGLAYVDCLIPEQIRQYRGTLTLPGKNSPYRNRSIAENIKLFKKMRNGNYMEGTACLRAKIDMASPLIVMRDPVLYRIKFTEHHRTGKKWCIYPMYDFTHCISDALEGITHSLCTLEFQENRRLYDWILSNISIRIRPTQYEFARLNLTYTILSKRKLNKIIAENIVEGWDDPRMPTISGLRRRGYTAKSIREFCLRIGVTKQDSYVDISALESCLRDDLNKIAPRAMAVLNPIKVIIENMSDHNIEMISMLNHPSNPEMGTRSVPFSNQIYIDRSDFREISSKNYKRLVLGQEVRLRNAYIIKAERIEKNNNDEITIIYCTYDPNTLKKNPIDGHKVQGVIHWVSVNHALPATFYIYDHLFKLADPNTTDNLLSIMNTQSLTIMKGFVEPSLNTATSKITYQFERKGYFCIDYNRSTFTNLVFNRTVSLRETQTNSTIKY
ncbi:Glutamine--tRNA ligase [Candidatus Profftia lariciata]|uniref:glutamine--tRNA ligase n=1 Tax=Candidatus Profftia lariciata TaxID=1987921 RepID=UPI001D01B663|nr:glutamine--tRNA ligase [Candidatus Profftia lariciata]UDG81703.1 Glutamine--tRNA ligase [Candidatus Profftia lariciata]